MAYSHSFGLTVRSAWPLRAAEVIPLAAGGPRERHEARKASLASGGWPRRARGGARAWIGPKAPGLRVMQPSARIPIDGA